MKLLRNALILGVIVAGALFTFKKRPVFEMNKPTNKNRISSEEKAEHLPSTPPIDAMDDRIDLLHDYLMSKVPDEFRWEREEEALKYIREPEWNYYHLLAFFAGCENNGRLWMNLEDGLRYRHAMVEVGIKDCAEVFRQLGLVQEKYDAWLNQWSMEELSKKVDEQDEEVMSKEDEVQAEMQAIEDRLPSESWEEIRALLWKYAVKHGFDKIPESSAGPESPSQ